MSGLVIERGGKLDEIYVPLEHQSKFHASTAPNCLMEGGAGSGKPTSLSTLIPTPSGWTTMGDVKVGDFVLNTQGRPTRVVWKSLPHINDFGTWRLTFDMGAEVVCGGSHEWVTTTYAERKNALRSTVETRAHRRLTRPERGGRGVKSMPLRPDKIKNEDASLPRVARRTADIAATLMARSGSHVNHAVPVSGAWVSPTADLPIDPYVLGAWLGDGTKGSSQFAGLDEEIFQEIARAGYEVRKVKNPKVRTVVGFVSQLKAHGFYRHKHVPDRYLWADASQRLALLQGLMDTDGTISDGGHVEFCNTNRHLADSVAHLARSLGIKTRVAVGRATLYGKDCGPKYRVMWTSSVPVFRLPRKAARVPTSLRETQRWHYIVKAERLADEPMQCIQVDDPSHEYLCTEAGIPTHNSKALRFDAYMRCLMVPRFKALILRRSMPELRLSHLDEVPFDAERLGLSKDAWHATNFTLRFPNGSTVVFAHVEDDATIARYLSSQFDAIMFDELATFTLRQFLFISSRARTDKPGLIPIVRGGTNPVGAGAAWVRRYFIAKDVTPDELPGYIAADYETVHSTIDDNPHVDRAMYEKRLNQLPSEALRRALRYGEWVVEGQAFGEWREATPDGGGWHVIDQLPTYHGRPITEASHIEIVRVVDWGYAPSGNPGMCQWYACLTDGSAIGFQEYVFKETLPKDVAHEIVARSQGMRVRYTVGDTAMWQEHEGPSIAEHFAEGGVPMIEADKARIPGWVQLHIWLRETIEDGLVTRPRLSYLRHGCPTTIRTIPQMVVDPANPADIVTRGVEDEGADCGRYFVMSRPGRSREKQADPALAWMFKEIAKRKRIGTRLGSEATRRVM